MRLLTAVALLSPGLVPGVSSAANVGVGVFGGASVPIVQEDNDTGSLFGVRVPVDVFSHLCVEPFYASTRDGDASQTIGAISYTRSGFDITSFGANVMLTLGGRVKFYPFAGLSTNKLSRPGTEDVTLTGYHFGLGLGITPAPKLSIHLRGEADAMSKSSSGRTFAAVTLGVSYDLFDLASHKGVQP